MSSADFLFTPTIQRVLAAALPLPGRSFYMRELVALADGGKGNAQRQIEKLIEAGVLIEEERRGRQRSIRANANFFLYPELASIVRKSFGVREPLVHALQPFAAEIEEAFVFGSVAKGSDTARSDIDLAVIGTVSLPELSKAILAVEQDLRRPVHLSVYDPAEWRELVAGDPVVAQIAQGPKLRLQCACTPQRHHLLLTISADLARGGPGDAGHPRQGAAACDQTDWNSISKEWRRGGVNTHPLVATGELRVHLHACAGSVGRPPRGKGRAGIVN